MKFIPNEDRVLVRPKPVPATIAGFIIPEMAKDKPVQGTIVSVGEGTKDIPMKFKAGDEIYYGKYAGSPIVFNKEDLLIMRSSDIFGNIG